MEVSLGLILRITGIAVSVIFLILLIVLQPFFLRQREKLLTELSKDN